MLLHPQFESDFSNPARFYKAVSLRHKRNPIFLPRLLRPRLALRRQLPKLISVDLSGIDSSQRGALTAWLISISTVASNGLLPETAISVLSQREIPFVNGQYADSILYLDTSRYDHGDICNLEMDLVLVITFNPNIPENSSLLNGDTIAMKDIVRKLLNKQTVDMNQIHICCMDISAVSVSLKMKKEGILKKQMSFSRNWMSPVCTERQRIVLSTTSKKVATYCSISAYIQIKWTSEKFIANRSKDVDDGHNNNSDIKNSSDLNRDLKNNLRKSPSPNASLVGRNSVGAGRSLIYYYMYTDKETQTISGKREVKDSICCLWCNSHFGFFCHSAKVIPPILRKRNKIKVSSEPLSKSTFKSMKYLLIHLRNCHFHFEYHAIKDEDENLFIFMRRDRAQDIDQQTLFREKMKPYFWSKRYGEDRDGFPSFCQDLPLLKIPVSSSLSNETESDDDPKIEVKESIGTMTRQYYHPRTGLPLVNEELGHESDEECVEWQNLALNNSAIDDFEDVGYEEKTFMKLWNSYIVALPPYGDTYIPFSCEIFAKRFAVQLVDQHLRYHFLFHLITFWEFGLLRAEDIQYLIAIVDKRVKEKQEEDKANELLV